MLSKKDANQVLRAVFDDSTGKLRVDTSDTSITTSTFDEVSGVASGVVTTVISYTLNEAMKLQKVSVSGSNVAQFDLLIDDAIQDRLLTSYINLNGIFDFTEGIALVANQVIKVNVVHQRQTLGSFNARLQLVKLI